MFRHALLAAALSLAAVPALAHTDHIGPNGGYAKDGGPVHVELVTRGNQLSVYAVDPATNKTLPIGAGSSGKAVILAGGKTVSVALAPQGAALAGQAPQAIPADAKIALTLKLPDRGAIPSLTFNLARLEQLRRNRP